MSLKPRVNDERLAEWLVQCEADPTNVGEEFFAICEDVRDARAELAAMRPVVEAAAAVARDTGNSGDYETVVWPDWGLLRKLQKAIDTYEKEETT